jgi:hypothetical protein
LWSSARWGGGRSGAFGESQANKRAVPRLIGYAP